MRKALSVDIAFVVVLVIATAMRLIMPGILTTWIDELNIIYPAIRLAQYGEMTWVGNESSFSFLNAHSPFSVYVTALPAILYPHPMFLRLFFGVLGVLSVAIAYVTMRRYIGYPAAITTGLLLSVMVLPVYWNRFVWNPNVAPVILMLYLYSALSGYHDRNKAMQWVHWICLSFAIQSQSALLILIPITVSLSLVEIWRSQKERTQSILCHAGIGIVVLITLVPWIIGLIGLEQGWWGTRLSAGNFDNGNITLEIPTASQVITTVGLLVSSAGYYVNAFALSENPASWWFPSPLHNVFYIQALLTIVGSFVLVGWHFYHQHEKRYISLFLIVCAGWSFILMSFDRVVSDFYMMLTPFAASMLAGWLVQILYRRSRLTLIMPILFVGLQLWLSITFLSYHLRDTNSLTYGEIVSLVDTWSASGTMDVLVLENEPNIVRTEQHEWHLQWLILSEIAPIRYSTDTQSIPLALDGTRIISRTPTLWLDDWASRSQIYSTDTRDFYTFDIYPASLPIPIYRSATFAQFGDLVRLDGFYPYDTSEDDMLWNGILFWQPLRIPEQTLQFSLRLKDETGATLAQHDQSSLNRVLWREGDVVLSQFALNTGDLVTDPDYLEIVMYSYPDLVSIPAVDDYGQSISQPIQLNPMP